MFLADSSRSVSDFRDLLFDFNKEYNLVGIDCMNIEVENSAVFWDKRHQKYNRDEIVFDNWLEKFDQLIEECATPVLDLGCGSGNDTLYLIKKRKRVISCDQSPNAIKNIKNNFPEIYDAKCFNMLDGIDFDDNMFDMIIADLCLHYFRELDTKRILLDIKRLLSPKGHLVLRVNSINDVNYGAGDGEEIEHHLYKTNEGMIKRFFDMNDINYFFGDFEIEYCKEEIITRYKLEKVVYCLCVK